MITIPPVSMLDWLIFVVVASVSLLILITVLKFIWRGPHKPPYQQKPLFSPAHTHALRLIDEAVASQLRVFTAVNAAEFMAVNPSLKKSQRELAWQHLYGEALDFVLCSPQDLKVRVAIVLTDPRLSKKEQRRQQQLWQALQATGLPMLEISPKDWPSASTLRADILTVCKAASAANSPISVKQATARVEPVISQIEDESTLEIDEHEPVIKLSVNE